MESLTATTCEKRGAMLPLSLSLSLSLVQLAVSAQQIYFSATAGAGQKTAFWHPCEAFKSSARPPPRFAARKLDNSSALSQFIQLATLNHSMDDRY